jgi:hypothetical protein
MRELREGLATRLRTVDGLGQVSEYQLSSPSPPCAYLTPVRTSRIAMGHHGVAPVEVVFTVTVLVVAGVEEAAQVNLDEIVDAGAVPAALEADQTLGGVASSVYVSGLSGYDPVVYGEGQAGWRAQYEVQVIA